MRIVRNISMAGGGDEVERKKLGTKDLGFGRTGWCEEKNWSVPCQVRCFSVGGCAWRLRSATEHGKGNREICIRTGIVQVILVPLVAQSSTSAGTVVV